MSALFQLANTCMSVVNSNALFSGGGQGGTQGGGQGSDQTGGTTGTVPDINSGNWSWVGDIVNAINQLLYPILILVGTAGVIYAIYLGVNLARADSADKQKEAKQRMINALVGLVSIIALILLLKLFCQMLPTWAPNLFITTGGSSSSGS